MAVQARNTARRSQSMVPIGPDQRVTVLKGFAALYPESLGDDFFSPVREITPLARSAPNDFDVAQALDLSWQSDYQPFLPDLRDRFLRTTQNHSAAVRMLRSANKQPVAILIHGYMTGHYHVEQRLWPVPRFLRSGYDVAFFTLPFHGIRANPLRHGAPEFPGADPRFTNEGFRQIIGDLRNFIQWLKSEGHPSVGVLGMSLGGYTASLLATVERELSFCIPVIPLASLADFAREQGELSSDPSIQAEEHALLEQTYRVVSPIHRAPRIAPERALVVAAKADRITPVAHARKLAAHFRAPLVSWHGGHLLQLGRDACFRRVETLIRELRNKPL